MALCKALLKGCSLSALSIAATWMSGCADDSAPPGTTPDSGPPLDVASDSKLDSPSNDSDTPGLDAAPDRADSSQCVAPRELLYKTEGCGVAAPAPICVGVGDPCAGTYCDCDGMTMRDWCEGAKRPFVHRGACTDGGDATPDSDATSPDVEPGDVADATDAEGGAPDASDADGADSGYVDAPACTNDASLVYDKAGCGAQTPAPVCRSGGDACASIFCSCDGSTFIDACNWASKPFAHFGACPDAPANWDAARDVVDNF